MKKSDFIKCKCINKNSNKEMNILIPIHNIEYLEWETENNYFVILKQPNNIPMLNAEHTYIKTVIND